MFEALLDTVMLDRLLGCVRALPVTIVGSPREVRVGEVLDGNPNSSPVLATDVALPGLDAFGLVAINPTLWVASAGTTFRTRVIDARASVLLVGLAGVVTAVVIPGSRRDRLDVFPQLSISAIAIEEMSEGERAEFLAYTDGVVHQIRRGSQVHIAAGDFLFLEWLEAGAMLASRSPAATAELWHTTSKPYTMRAARVHRPEERWMDADHVTLAAGVPMRAHDAMPGVRMLLVQGSVVAIDQTFDAASLHLRILDELIKHAAPMTVVELKRLAPDVAGALSELRRDGWLTRLQP